jgi:hypothetical protein
MYLLSQPRSIDHGVAEEFQWRVDFDPFVALTFWWHWRWSQACGQKPSRRSSRRRHASVRNSAIARATVFGPVLRVTFDERRNLF